LKTFFGIPVEKGQYNLKCDLKICMTDSTSTEKLEYWSHYPLDFSNTFW
jgi:hypothetical protein